MEPKKETSQAGPAAAKMIADTQKRREDCPRKGAFFIEPNTTCPIHPGQNDALSLVWLGGCVYGWG